MISSRSTPATTGASRLSTGAPAVSSRSMASISLFIGPDGRAIGVGLFTLAALAGTVPVAVPLVVVAVLVVVDPFDEPRDAALAAVPSVGAALEDVPDDAVADEAVSGAATPWSACGVSFPATQVANWPMILSATSEIT